MFRVLWIYNFWKCKKVEETKYVTWAIAIEPKAPRGSKTGKKKRCIVSSCSSLALLGYSIKALATTSNFLQSEKLCVVA